MNPDFQMKLCLSAFLRVHVVTDERIKDTFKENDAINEHCSTKTKNNSEGQSVAFLFHITVNLHKAGKTGQIFFHF